LSTTIDKAPSEALSLFLDQNEKGQVDSSVPVRWCISRKTAEMIEAEGILDPQLLIVIEQDGQELQRYVFPLEDQMRYIQFRRPGTNTIHATVLWQPDDEEASVKTILEKRDDNGQYRADTLDVKRPETEALEAKSRSLQRERSGLDESTEAYATLSAQIDQVEAEVNGARSSESPEVNIRVRFDSITRIGGEFQLDVMVPEEMFAKEPPRWMKWLGTKYAHWNNAARDQCDLRRRALFTLFTLPFYWAWRAIRAVGFAVFAVIVLAGMEIIILAQAAFFLLLGLRNIDFHAIREPIDKYGDARVKIGENYKPSFWTTKKVENSERPGEYKYELRHPVLLVLNPPVLLLMAGIAFGLYLTLSQSLFQIILAIVIVVFATVLLLIGALAGEGKREARALRREQEAQERKERQQAELRKELEQLACSSASREVSVSALPRERRTVALRFQALKSQVCKPFAR
jgi:hypothetical protein